MKIFTKFLLVIGGVFMLSIYANAQTPAPTNIVRGKIIDSKDSSPVIGATVAELDKDNRTIKGVVTDIEGNFVLRMNNPSHVLSFSSIGYKTQKTQVNGKKTFEILLVSTENEMDEVVVSAQRNDNGLLSHSDRSNTMAVSKIDTKAIEEMQGASIDQMLQGRLAGVDITASSGDPGAGMQIRIRGTSSINSAVDPMVVVDGMPYETAIPSDFNFGTADELGYASLLNLAPTDIKNITILKDAAATAMWGS